MRGTALHEEVREALNAWKPQNGKHGTTTD